MAVEQVPGEDEALMVRFVAAVRRYEADLAARSPRLTKRRDAVVALAREVEKRLAKNPPPHVEEWIKKELEKDA